MNMVVAGGTGFIGSALVDALVARGDKTTLLVRDEATARARWGAGVSVMAWDGKTAGAWAQALDGADAIVNLVGESVAAMRWSAARKKILLDSRVGAIRALLAAASQASKRPRTFVSASAVGYYGDVPEGASTESSPQGRDSLAVLCGQWEREALALEPLGVRVVLARLGIVLAREGGALPKMAVPFKFLAGGPLGTGRQGFPWIHRDDVVGGVLFVLDHDELSGPVNIAAPGATSNREFSAALGRALGRPSWMPTPAFALELALGELAGMLLGGQRVTPKKLLDAGYLFKYADVATALSAIYRR